MKIIIDSREQRPFSFERFQAETERATLPAARLPQGFPPLSVGDEGAGGASIGICLPGSLSSALCVGGESGRGRVCDFLASREVPIRNRQAL